MGCGEGEEAVVEAGDPTGATAGGLGEGAGQAEDRKAATGRAPMAARSLSPRARVRWPTDSGECQSRRK